MSRLASDDRMTAADTRVVFLDVTALPAPEPLQRALEELAELPPGCCLHFHHRQYPVLLYERLEARGFEELTCRGLHGTCDVFIWAASDDEGEHLARAAAAGLERWE